MLPSRNRTSAFRGITRGAIVLALSMACGGAAEVAAPVVEERGRVSIDSVVAPLTIGRPAQFRASVISAAGTPLTAPLAWSSTDSSVARVSSTGLVTPLREGGVHILARSGAMEASTATIVVQLPALNVATSDARTFRQLAYGDSVQLQVTALDAQGAPMPVDGSVTWESSDPTIASISPQGVVRISRSAAEKELSVFFTAHALGTRAGIGFSIAPVQSGLPATVRYVNVNSQGPVTFVTPDGATLSLSQGESRVVSARSGVLDVRGANLAPGVYPTLQSIATVVQPGGHVTVYAMGDASQGFMMAVDDGHPPIPPGTALVRIVAANYYSPTYTDNVHLVPAGAPISGIPDLCYFDMPSVSAYVARAASPFDVVLANQFAVSGTPGPTDEWMRFHATPESGKAYTYVILGASITGMSLMRIDEP
ncbi:MAG: Ig domain protein group 2 domain protein [Gemmatimonadetes bacterium]|nr:Ig domain protein group 2 domain protein [Gemmatimonadota bacterium]